MQNSIFRIKLIPQTNHLVNQLAFNRGNRVSEKIPSQKISTVSTSFQSLFAISIDRLINTQSKLNITRAKYHHQPFAEIVHTGAFNISIYYVVHDSRLWLQDNKKRVTTVFTNYKHPQTEAKPYFVLY